MDPSDWLHRVGAWREFYIFTGTAASTLMGLMFVVMSLAQRTLMTQQGRGAVGAFFTPIVAFFVTEMIVSMLLLIPAITPLWLGLGLAAAGLFGMGYMLARAAHARWKGRWDLDPDDWTWYFALPALSYLVLIASGIFSYSSSAYGLYGAALVMGALLLIGVRNAWDLTVYTLMRPESQESQQGTAGTPQAGP
ncbi:MAG TPA: hypothetical protein VGZ02_14855 [Candidatus Baltobacteraceae bacterium]|jgi:hypothetical protein|nr:hypothetical protein [Candidatus Baltobacteraceae bacterium]